MKLCPKYQEELARCAAWDETPLGEIADHLARCRDCALVFDQLRSAARSHLRTAAELPEPRRSASTAAWFLNSQKFPSPPHPPSNIRLRFSLSFAGLTLFAALLALFLFTRGRPSLDLPVSLSAASPNLDQPTWQALRRELHSEEFKPLYRDSGHPDAAQYRLKHAHFGED